MSITTLSESCQPNLRNGADETFDDGLQHAHQWASERCAGQPPCPIAANAAVVATPSTALHDDALYS